MRAMLSVLARDVRPRVLARQPVRVGRPVRSGARAVTDPDRAGAQHTPQLAGAGQVGPVPRAQREVLGLTGQIATQAERARVTGRGPGLAGRAGEPVIRVRPGGRLLGIEPGPGQLIREPGELMTAPLPDEGERDRVPGQVQRDLERLPGPVPARHCSHGQHGAINAA
jgi:hypothetical protein